MPTKKSDVTGVSSLREIFFNLFEATGIPSALIDTEGNILSQSGWQGVCVDFHRKNERTRQICEENILEIQRQLENRQAPITYQCPLGPFTSCFPVILDGEHVASVFSGQFFPSPLSGSQLQEYQKQAENYGFDEDAYLGALRNVPIVSAENHKKTSTFIARLAGMIIETTSQAKAVKESEEKLKNILDAIHEGIWEWDIRANVLKLNDKCLEILGDTKRLSDISYNDFKLLVHPDDRSGVVECFEKTVHNRSSCHQEFRLQQGDSAYVWVLCRGRVVEFGADGESLLVAGTLVDVSDKQQFKQSFESAYHYAPILMTISEIATGRYISANQTFYKTTGFTEDAVIGNTSIGIGLLDKKDREYLLHLLRKNGRIENLRLKLRRADGETFYCDYSGVIIPVDGADHLLTLATDVTEIIDSEQERERMARQLRQAQKLEAIGTLAGGIAHDFNNILSAMIGYTDMAMDDLEPGSQTLNDLQNVMDAGNRAKDLVGQILAFSRQTESNKIIVKPSTILKEAVRMLRSTLPSNIKIETDIGVPSSLVYADPVQLHQVVMNLCTNAFHAMQERGGTLTIIQQKCSQLPLRLLGNARSKNAEHIQISIKDTGAGIDPSIIDRIFDPFFTTKPEGKGTGMGLSISYSIMASIDGAVTVESIPGEGAVFHLFIPVTKSKEESGYIDSVPLPTGSETILVVDDEKQLVTMTKGSLERLGYSVVEAYGGTEAFEIFEKNPQTIDLVITDYTMPGLTGFDLSGRLLFQCPDLPIILCTGFSEKVNENSVRRNGIRGLLYKPVLKKDMAMMIRDLLDKKKMGQVSE